MAIKRSECIFGGKDANLGDFPYAVSIREKGFDHSCGGAIIRPHFIVTSAVCMQNFNNRSIDDFLIWKPRDLVAWAGIVKSSDANATVFNIEEITRHAQFDLSTSAHDLALLRTKEEIKFEGNILPVDLPDLADTEKRPKPGMDVTVAGWGYFDDVFYFLPF